MQSVVWNSHSRALVVIPIVEEGYLSFWALSPVQNRSPHVLMLDHEYNNLKAAAAGIVELTSILLGDLEFVELSFDALCQRVILMSCITWWIELSYNTLCSSMEVWTHSSKWLFVFKENKSVDKVKLKCLKFVNKLNKIAHETRIIHTDT
jgi:hypothetical protein